MTPLEVAWEMNAYAQRVHTYDAWMVAADAFEEAGRPDIATRLREAAQPLRTNLPRRELLHVAVRAAERAMTGKRPTEKLFARARSLAFDAIRKADRLSGTTHHRSVKNGGQIGKLAARGVLLARRLLWIPPAHRPAWASRLKRDAPRRPRRGPR